MAFAFPEPVDPSDVPESFAHSSDLPMDADMGTISDVPNDVT